MPDTRPDTIRQLSTKVVYDNPWMIVREDEVERPDGSHGIYAYIDKPDFVLVVPLEDDGFHLVEEYRYPMRRRSWSFPQGTAVAATREEEARIELAQETGLRAASWTLLGELDNAHGLVSQHLYVYLATDLERGPVDREDTEQDMVHRWVSRAEFERMIRAGEVRDSSSIAAYALLAMGLTPESG